MVPKVTEVSDENGKLTFRVSNINVSLANGLRRIILSEIPTIVFKTFPHDKNKANIEINTSRFNNEIVKQRLSCIPIHITDIDFNYADHSIEIDKNNTTDVIQYVTTGDIKIKNTKNDSYLSDAEVRKIFPPDNITAQFIDIVRLRPALSKTLEGEHLKLNCAFSVGTAKENSSYNVASTCCYKASQDVAQMTGIWSEMEKKYKAEKKSKEEIAAIKEDWLLLDAKRIILPDSFEFIVESVGVFSARSIVEKACQVMINKLDKFIKDISERSDMILPSENTIDNCYDINLVGEDYTLGKVIEYLIYAMYYESTGASKVVTYCGFIKPHPHIDKSIIRVAFVGTTIEKDVILGYLMETQKKALEIYTILKRDFATDE